MDSTPTNVNDSLIQRVNVAKDSTPINVNNSVIQHVNVVGRDQFNHDNCKKK